MEEMLNSLSERVDQEWMKLILQAKDQGIDIEEIRFFLTGETSKLNIKEEV